MLRLGRARRALVTVLGGMVLVLALVALAASWPVVASTTSADRPAVLPPDSIEGHVVALASSIRQQVGEPASEPSVSVVLQSADGLVHVTLTANVHVVDEDGSAIAPHSIRPMALVRVQGQRVSEDRFEASLVQVLGN